MHFTSYRTSLRRPWAVWLAVLVVLLGALAPTVSHALAFASGQAPLGAEVCTSQGPRVVAPANTSSLDDSPTGQGSALSLQHCPFCLHPADRVAPAPHLLPYLFSVQGGQQEVPVWQAFFYVSRHCVAPPPRGPPGFF